MVGSHIANNSKWRWLGGGREKIISLWGLILADSRVPGHSSCIRAIWKCNSSENKLVICPECLQNPFLFLQSSYNNNSIVAPPGQVLTVENTLRYPAFTARSNGTRPLLDYIQNRFGPVSSFTTGVHRVDNWKLEIGTQTPSCSKCVCLHSPDPSRSNVPLFRVLNFGHVSIVVYGMKCKSWVVQCYFCTSKTSL